MVNVIHHYQNPTEHYFCYITHPLPEPHYRVLFADVAFGLMFCCLRSWKPMKDWQPHHALWLLLQPVQEMNCLHNEDHKHTVTCRLHTASVIRHLLYGRQAQAIKRDRLISNGKIIWSCPMHATKIYGGRDVNIHLFLIITLDGNEWSASGYSHPMEKPSISLLVRMGGPKRQSGHFGKEKTLVLLWDSKYNFSVVQPTAQHTDYAILASKE